MMKKIAILLLLLLCPIIPSHAEIVQGTTFIRQTTPILSPATGTLTDLAIRPGDTVTKGEQVGSVKENRVFCQYDGTVTAVFAQPGHQASEGVIEITPTEKYLIYCSTSKAYESPENSLLHVGEYLYMRCTGDGSHRGIGQVVSVSGSEYQVEAIAGELYNGENVYLYRDAQFTPSQRVGIGTVSAAESISITCDGTVLKMNVSPGDHVSRGQLLFTWTDAQIQNDNILHANTISAPDSLMITETLFSPGETVNRDAIVAWGAKPQDVRLTCQIRENLSSAILPGTCVYYTRADDSNETRYPAIVETVSGLVQDETVTLTLATDEELPVGLSVEIYFETEP